MKQIFDVPAFPKKTQSANQNDETEKKNQSKEATVRINCEIDKDDTEVRNDRQIIEKDSSENRIQTHAQKMKNLFSKNKENDNNLRDQNMAKLTHIDQSVL